jgi:nicotinamidase/pyrazinamidase
MKRVFLDVDTQLDFVVPAGALYVPGAEKLIGKWKRLAEHAAASGIPVISTVDAHEENDVEFFQWPPHCVRGTLGQRKPEGLTNSAALLQPFRSPFSSSGPGRAPQVIVEKTTTDCFAEPNFLRVLEWYDADLYVVYGVATEVCVKHALHGLLRHGKKVEVLTDAIREIDPARSAEMLREYQAAGGGISTAFA